MARRKPIHQRNAAFRRRSKAARRGWITRRANQLQKQVEHGKRARVKTERRLTPQQKAKRTRDANRIEREKEKTRSRGGSRGKGKTIRSLRELDDYYDYPFDFWEIETSPDYE